jgi:hypothetical protein
MHVISCVILFCTFAWTSLCGRLTNFIGSRQMCKVELVSIGSWLISFF